MKKYDFFLGRSEITYISALVLLCKVLIIMIRTLSYTITSYFKTEIS